MKTQWVQRAKPERADIERISGGTGLGPVISTLLLQRGIRTVEEARAFFRPSKEHIPDPFLMKDMDKAVQRLTLAIDQKERILVYGDYDVDGTTSVALVYSFLRELGVNCDFYIPDRFTEGYGFSRAGVEWAVEHGVGLIITLDCGIKDAARIELAAQSGIDVIVCDHHNPDELPPACAVLDPKRPDCSYPYKGLSGCGVGFKLLQAYCMKRGIPDDFLFAQLDLLAISIGADIVPLTGENRVLATLGLRLLQGKLRPGIQAMLSISGFKRPQINISDVVFVIAPRINAAGRILSGRSAVQLLISTNEEEAHAMSQHLEEVNQTRKDLDKDITASAIELVESDAFYLNSFSTVVQNDNWSKGVIGIVASRLVETYYKPAIVLTRKGGMLSGSARSIQGLDLYDLLSRCEDLLEQFGGHTMAAGLSLREEHFLSFRQRFDELVATALNHVLPQPQMEYDMEISLGDLSQAFAGWIGQFAPFGPENMKPLFLSRNLTNAGFTRAVGETGAHLKLNLRQEGCSQTVDGIGFDLGTDWASVITSGEAVDVLFSVEENVWNGRTSVQMNVRDIRLSVSESARADLSRAN